MPLEIKNVAGNWNKNLKLLWKTFYTLTHFTQLNSTLVNCELRTVPQGFIIAVWWFKVSVYVHYVSTLEFISVINQLDAQNFCFTVSLFHASTRYEHYTASGITTPIGVMIPEAV